MPHRLVPHRPQLPLLLHRLPTPRHQLRKRPLERKSQVQIAPALIPIPTRPHPRPPRHDVRDPRPRRRHVEFCLFKSQISGSLPNDIDCSMYVPGLPGSLALPYAYLCGKGSERRERRGATHLQRRIVRNILLRLARGRALAGREGHDALQAVGVFGDDLAGGDGGDEELGLVAF